MSKRIYVGGLPYSINETALQELFSPFGQVADVPVVTDRYSGAAKGFAFVEMPNESEAQQAIQPLNGSELGGMREHPAWQPVKGAARSLLNW